MRSSFAGFGSGASPWPASGLRSPPEAVEPTTARPSLVPGPLDERQTEFLLTSAQALLAFAVLADRIFGLWDALAIFWLFVVQFPFPTTDVRLIFSAVYIVVALGLLAHRRLYLPGIIASVGRWERSPDGGR